MSTVEGLRAATEAAVDGNGGPVDWIVMTADQQTLLRGDAHSLVMPRIGVYRPDGSYAQRDMFVAPNLYGSPMSVRETGADISDLTGTVLDLRSV